MDSTNRPKVPQIATPDQQNSTTNVIRHVTIGDDADVINISPGPTVIVNIKIGSKTRSWTGQMSDDTVQQLIRERIQSRPVEQSTGSAGSAQESTIGGFTSQKSNDFDEFEVIYKNDANSGEAESRAGEQAFR